MTSQPWDPMDPPEVGPRRSPGLWGPEEVWRGQVQSCSHALRGALPVLVLCGTAEQKARWDETSLHPWDPMDPP